MAWHRIDYDGLWSSDKLSHCSDEAQADYLWVYGIADAHGCFELTNMRSILGKVAPNRKDFSVERLERDFGEYRTKGLCFTWSEGLKRYGYWTGCEKRLPSRSTRERYPRSTPEPPKAQLDEYVCSFGGTVPQPTEPLAEGEPLAQPQRVSQSCEANLEASRDCIAIESRPYRDNGNGTVTEREQTHTSLRPAAAVCAPSPQPTEQRFEGEQPAQPQPGGQQREAAPAVVPQPVEPTKESQEGKPEQLPLGQSCEEKPRARVLFEIYEQERGPLPAVREMTPERLSKCRKRLLSHAKSQERFLADFRAAVRKASQIAWRQWRPSFDWFIGNDTNIAKVLEGNYDRWGDGATPSAPIRIGGRQNAEQRTRNNLAAAGFSVH